MDATTEHQPLIDEIFRDKVRHARRQSPESKFVAGLELFDEALVRMRGGIQAQFPHFSPAQVETELHRRINRVRQVQEHGFFTTTPPA
jgi:hypothetical protein